MNFKGKPKFNLQVRYGTSKPDAVIDFPTHRLLLEVKVRAQMDADQLNRHLAEQLSEAGKETEKQVQLLVITDNKRDSDEFFSSNSHLHDKIKFKTWGEIYTALCKSITPKKNDSKEWFVLAEFLRYMELMNLKPFTGFTKDDFEYFYEMDDDYGQILKKNLEILANDLTSNEKIKNSGFSKDYPFLKPGNIKKRNSDKNIWIAFTNPSDTPSFRTSNFCITLRPESLSLNLVLSGQKCKDPNSPIHYFDKYLSDAKAAKEFFSNLEGMTITIFERTNGNGKSPSIAGDIWKKRIAIETAFLKTPESAKFLQNILKEIKFPGINIGKVYSKDEVIGKSKEELIDDMAKQLPLLYDALKQIRGTK